MSQGKQSQIITPSELYSKSKLFKVSIKSSALFLIIAAAALGGYISVFQFYQELQKYEIHQEQSPFVALKKPDSIFAKVSILFSVLALVIAMLLVTYYFTKYGTQPSYILLVLAVIFLVGVVIIGFTIKYVNKDVIPCPSDATYEDGKCTTSGFSNKGPSPTGKLKERISKRSTRDLVQEGISLLKKFKDPFKDGGMTRAEKGLLATIESNSSSVFEWGMGSSTILAAAMGVKRLHSIDSVRQWVSNCAKKIANNNIVPNPDSYILGWVNIGPVGAWGWPKNDLYRDFWPSYPSAVQNEKEPFDVYFVDGRFRVACALQAFLHGHENSLVLMHDFNRKEYHVILDVADMLHRKGNLAVLARKSNVKDEEILSMYEIYQYIPDREKGVRKVSPAKIASRAPLQPEGITRIPIPQN